MEESKGQIVESIQGDKSESSVSAGKLIGRVLGSSTGSAVAFWGLMLLATLPFLVAYSRAMWHQELYQYFPFLLVGVFGLAYTRHDRQMRFPTGKLSFTTLVIGIIFLVFAAAIHSSWLGALGFIFITISFLSTLRSRSGKTLTYLALPMLMFIRAPQLWTHSVMWRLQKATTKLSSILLDVVGIPHDHSGNTIELATKHLFVAEACSGVQSLFTMCFLSLLLLVYRHRTLLLTPIYLLVALVLAVMGNIIRVTTIALAESWFSIDLTEGWQHELVGYIALAISAGVLLSFDHLISVLFHPIEASEMATSQNPLIFAWNKVFYKRSESSSNWTSGSKQDDETSAYSQYDAAFDAASKSSGKREFPLLYRVLATVAVICGLVMFAWKLLGTSDRRPIVATDAILFEPSKEFLASVNAPIVVADHRSKRDRDGDVNDRLGKHADVWRCGVEGREGEFVISQPYVGWHELSVCYRVLNWSMVSRRPIEVPGATEPIVFASFVNEEGLYGYLFFAAIDSDGDFPRTPGYSPSARALAPFYPLITDDFAETTGSAQTIMMQYWTVSETEIEPEVVTKIATTMSKIRQNASQEIAKQSLQMLPDA
tara:strand:- start:246979 stop:248775 length:1797 start_codon:yes stop_codon:yes gene_type:complete